MTVHFIGAGPGAADLITLRGRDLIARCPVCLYAGSIVPRALLGVLPAGRAHRRYRAVVARRDRGRVRGGACGGPGRGAAAVRRPLDLQRARRAARRLERRGIPYTLTPGVPAFAAAAAALGCELTVPEVAQSVVLTRVSGRASRMPAARDACRLRRDRRDARHPSRHPRARDQVVADADADLRRRLPGRRGRRGEPARRADRARHAWRHRRQARRRPDRAHAR